MAEAVSRLLLSILLCCFWTIYVLPIAEAVWMSLPSSGTKCVSEEIHSNVVVLGNYYSFYDGDHSEKLPSISVTVTSPYGNNLYQKENVTHGEFAFTTSEAGYYVACFSLDGNHHEGDGAVSLGIDWKIGIAAKDWESVAKKEKIEGVELELTKLQGAVQAIHDNLNYLKNREAEMREVSERTNARVAWFSGMALGVCIVVSCAQLWYLKRFFQKKKLI